MGAGLTVLLMIIATLSVPLTLRRYRSATPEQRRQMIWAYCGAIGGGVLVGILFAIR